MTIWPVVIVKDRYCGVYSNGEWTAFNRNDIPEGCYSGDCECADFWTDEQKQKTGLGRTPNEAVLDLEKKIGGE